MRLVSYPPAANLLNHQENIYTAFNVNFQAAVLILVADFVVVRYAKIIRQGYAMLLGSIGVKFPQILNIFASSSAEGLSPMSFYTEVPLTITHVAYNYLQGNPFSSYGDSMMILFQNLILVGMLWAYMKPKPTFLTMLSVLGMFLGVAAVSLSLPSHLQAILPLSSLPLMLSSRVPQIIKNWRSKSTGSLSSITNLLISVGSAARVFTTIQE
eukprot:gene9570-19884_t